MRGHGFIEGKRRRVARTRQHAQNEGADAAADLRNLVGVLEEFHKEVDDAAGAQPRREHTGRNDDAHDVGVAFAHAVKELLRHGLGIGARHDERVDHTDQHGGRDRNLHAGNPQREDDEENHGNERSQRKKNVRVFGKLARTFGLKFAEAFLLEVAVDETHHRHQDDRSD